MAVEVKLNCEITHHYSGSVFNHVFKFDTAKHSTVEYEGDEYTAGGREYRLYIFSDTQFELRKYITSKYQQIDINRITGEYRKYGTNDKLSHSGHCSVMKQAF